MSPDIPGSNRGRLGWIVAVVVAAFAGGAASGGLVSFVASDRGADNGDASFERRVISGDEVAVVSLIEAAAPAIVTIINESPPVQDDQGRIIERVSVGSGFVTDTRGFVVTNEHVVRDAGKLVVVFPNGEERPASIVSHDAPFTDLAVLRIPAGNLRALPFGRSGELRIGQTVVAVGSALFEYRNSVTVGVVSGLNRRYFREQVMMEDLIQTDAAINSGNSGGPLMTTKGEVVGLTTNVVRRIGTVENVYGIAFAISSRTMEPIVKAIIDRGSFPRPYLGIDHLELDDSVAAQRNLRVNRGALVQRVVEGSPAQAAGVRNGDIILRLGRIELNEEVPFINALARLTPRERVPVQLVRDGRAVELMVEVGQR